MYDGDKDGERDYFWESGEGFLEKLNMRWILKNV